MAKSIALLEKRNVKIIERYKEFYHKQRLQHTKCLELLSEEFFLTPQSLSLIILKGKKQSKPKEEIVS